MSGRSNLAWLAVILSLQIILGIVCGSLAVQQVFFKAPLSNFGVTQARAESDLSSIIEPSKDPHGYLAAATKENAASLQEASFALAWLVFSCSIGSTFFSMFGLILIRVMRKSSEEAEQLESGRRQP